MHIQQEEKHEKKIISSRELITIIFSLMACQEEMIRNKKNNTSKI
jgi:hypothetical protein